MSVRLTARSRVRDPLTSESNPSHDRELPRDITKRDLVGVALIENERLLLVSGSGLIHHDNEALLNVLKKRLRLTIHSSTGVNILYLKIVGPMGLWEVLMHT